MKSLAEQLKLRHLANVFAPQSNLGQRTTATETQRVVQLPTRAYSGVDMTARLQKPGAALSLWPIQSAALAAIEEAQGGFLPIGVGHGKSLIALLAGTVLRARLAIVLAPATTIPTLLKTWQDCQQSFRTVTTRIISYSELSRARGTALLEELVAKYSDEHVALICDEAHKVGRQQSARTKRVVRLLTHCRACDKPQAEHTCDSYEPRRIRVVTLSGTMMDLRDIRRAAHLAEMSLRHRSPLPRDKHHLDAWSETIGVSGRPSYLHWQVMAPLWRFAYNAPMDDTKGQERQALMRQAFQERLRSAPGVVASQEGSLGASLIIRRIEAQPELPESTLELLHQAMDGIAPDGEVLLDDLSQHRTVSQLSLGFYYRWVWPNGLVDQEWLDARSTWGRHVRYELEHSARQGYDSPLLISQEVQRRVEQGGKLSSLAKAWLAWSAVKARPEPPVEPVWLTRCIIDWAAAWASATPGIIWYQSKAVGDALADRGLDVYGAGHEPRTDKARSCAMSIRAHGIGKNLQPWCEQLVIEPPSSGEVWEQLLGRTHRAGQLADEVTCDVLQHTLAFRRALSSARVQATATQDATGNAQKLAFATYTEDCNERA